MATLLNKNFDLKSVKTSDFCAEIRGAFICNAFLVADEGLIVVEELSGNSLYTSLFDVGSLEKIPVQSRYEKYNEMKLIERKSEYECHTLITVDPEYGTETLEEKVFLNGKEVYCERSDRYSRIATPSLWDRYNEYLSSKNNERDGMLIDFHQYGEMSVDEKVTFFSRRLHAVHKPSYELDIPIECMFLSDEEFVEYDKDAEFRIALLKALKLEMHFSGEDVNEIFERIIRHHGGRSVC